MHKVYFSYLVSMLIIEYVVIYNNIVRKNPEPLNTNSSGYIYFNFFRYSVGESPVLFLNSRLK